MLTCSTMGANADFCHECEHKRSACAYDRLSGGQSSCRRHGGAASTTTHTHAVIVAHTCHLHSCLTRVAGFEQRAGMDALLHRLGGALHRLTQCACSSSKRSVPSHLRSAVVHNFRCDERVFLLFAFLTTSDQTTATSSIAKNNKTPESSVSYNMLRTPAATLQLLSAPLSAEGLCDDVVVDGHTQFVPAWPRRRRQSEARENAAKI